ncbi:RNase adapter RapZ [Fluviispira multicolorata]|uniref:RNase adapter RapZ n=1 Tax=Fluviispira multicolorata TaxID=2654512 RepID=A0A833JDB4_9BACT|nr:RNase adapter RapZ [Fluviispira multicolorata]KAB8031770.1 RNase adapter RapZ [Fluviispira multicolorata]
MNDILLTDSQNKKKLVIVTGLAGSGKTIAIHALEDLGYYCIDNLPSVLLKSFTDSIKSEKIKYPHIALALDSRDKDIPNTFQENYEVLSELCHLQILYLKASDDVVIKRFRETRRQHPLNTNEPRLSLIEAINLDIVTLEPIKNLANRILDTSNMSTQNLKRFLHNHFALSDLKKHLLLNIVSFGFKYNSPNDLDTIFDVRCFKNPHYESHLRELTGLDPSVKNYVFSDNRVQPFIDKVVDLIQFLYPLYLDEGKHYFSIGIGCTGGKHRSVAISEELARIFRETLPFVNVEHRHAELE